MSPYDAKTLNEVCSLRRDNFDLPTCWILTDGVNVTISEQKNGEEAKQSLTLPRTQFNALVRWYLRDQKKVRK